MSGVARALRAWLDTAATPQGRGIDWPRVLPYVALHLSCVAVIVVGVSPLAIAVALALYLLRMFAITGFYHRYFSHRAFRTSRALQFVFASLAASAVQRGPLWWAAHHRHHHAHADQPEDPHSPAQHGFFWSHTGWFMAREHFGTRTALVRDLARYPELRLLDRFDILVPLLLALALFAAGELLRVEAPRLGTDGWQLLVWGFSVSTVVLYHATFTVNSLAHRLGSRRYATRDDSRNNWFIALCTLGEGWHNNHHHYMNSVRQGFFWWEIDFTYYILTALSWVGVTWDLAQPPARIYATARTSARAELKAA
jgi:stearoyl-CoA desaturase (delta-9 desaturase)